jgi:endonuclease-3
VKVPQEELAEDVRPTGFFNNKAKAIRAACQYLIDHYKGEVPKTMAELVTLPGVARKTANVILGNAFNISDGFIADTHVLRLAQRFGWSSNTDANKVEQDLMKLIPPEHWLSLAHEIILFGRNTCTARKPACVGCILADVCPSEGIVS